MKKVLSILAGLVLAGVCFAETDYIAMPIIQDIQKGVNNNNAITDMYIKDDLTVVDDAAIGGLATVGGTLGVTGVATFTAESVHNLGIDTDYVTVDAGAGVDTKTAGTLMVGAATANKVEVSVAGVETEIQGTLDVIQAADFDAAVTMGSTLAVMGASTLPVKTHVLDGTATRIMTSADYGKLLTFTNGAAVAVTLPANGAAAGSWVDVAVGAQTGGGGDSCAVTVSAATADTLIGPNDVDLDSVTWGAGHRIGAYARFWSDGTFWHVLNLGGTTMTYTD